MKLSSKRDLRSAALRHGPFALALLGAVGCQGRLALGEAGVDGGLNGGGTGTDSSDAGTQTSPTCEDGIRSGDESDIDCGGTECPACAAEFSCERHEDCQSGMCRAGLCSAPACDDGVRNGGETGVDCGGPCMRCRTSACNCATTAALSAVSCDETLGYIEYSFVSSITPDAQTAFYGVLYSTGARRAFRWTAAEGLTPVGDGFPLDLSSDGTRALYTDGNGNHFLDVGTQQDLEVPLYGPKLSQDGSHVLGSPVETNGGYELTRWTPQGGSEPVAALPAGSSWTVTALAPDASAAVGWGWGQAPDDNISLPFRWTATGGLSDLGALPAGADGARPLALSDDGAVVVGVTLNGSDLGELFRWSDTEGFTSLGAPHDIMAGVQLFVSADGSVVAGTKGADGVGFRWTSAAETPLLPEGGWSMAKDMTKDGSIVLGAGSTSGFLWTAAGLTRFSNVLAARGVALEGWELGEPQKLAPDGSYAFGQGRCGGVPVTYRLVLGD